MTKAKVVPQRYQQNWLESLDGRTAIAREMRRRFALLSDDLGGEEAMSYAQRSLAERGLFLELWMQSQEQLLSDGKEFDVNKYTTASNSLQGIFMKLGLERRSKELSLSDFIKAKQTA